MTKKDSKGSFNLIELKFRKDNGLNVTYSQIEEQGGNIISTKIEEKCNAGAHPDVDSLQARLRIHFAAIHGLVPVSFVKKSFEDMKPKEKELYQKMESTITIKGFTIVGSDDDDKKYILKANREVMPGGNIGMSTPKIMQDDSRYDGSAELTSIMQLLEAEAFEYIVNKKHSQIAMEFPMVEADRNQDNTGLEAK